MSLSKSWSIEVVEHVQDFIFDACTKFNSRVETNFSAPFTHSLKTLAICSYPLFFLHACAKFNHSIQVTILAPIMDALK